MLPADVLRQVRRLHLRARRVVQTLLGGEYHSAFKGAGLSFEEVREYQPGDDVRTIDWNVTARTGQAHIKRFVEERELTMILMVDVSGSQSFGTGRLAKRAAVAELAALLALCAVSNNDRVGLIAFSEEVERFVPPNKGPRHVLRLLRDILAFDPKKRGTNLGAALDYLNKVQRRRAIVFLLSDFLAVIPGTAGVPPATAPASPGDPGTRFDGPSRGRDGRGPRYDGGFEAAFRRAARKHDLIAVRTTDPREVSWPAAGLVRLEDAETGRQFTIDTSNRAFREGFEARSRERLAAFTKLARGSQADLIEAGTDGKHFDALLSFFRKRERRHRGGHG